MKPSRTNQYEINGLAQDSSNSITNALELLQSCAKPSKCSMSSTPDGHIRGRSRRLFVFIKGENIHGKSGIDITIFVYYSYEVDKYFVHVHF